MKYVCVYVLNIEMYMRMSTRGCKYS